MEKYAITRNKFMSTAEMTRLVRKCKRQARLDSQEGRKTWITRYMLVHFAINSGLRVSEIAALKIRDLHLNGEENYLLVKRGKGGKKRFVYIDKGLVKHIREYQEIKKQWQESTESDAPLFTGRGGQHYTTTALEISFKQAIIKSGLSSRFSIHSSRHTYATLLLSKTNNLRFVQRQLGHANITMTSLYADIMPEMNQRLANAILK